MEGRKMEKKAALMILWSRRGEKPFAELFEAAHLEWVKRLAARYKAERMEKGGWVRLRKIEMAAEWVGPELEEVMERVAS
jgi:hypothetical protein